MPCARLPYVRYMARKTRTRATRLAVYSLAESTVHATWLSYAGRGRGRTADGEDLGEDEVPEDLYAGADDALRPEKPDEVRKVCIRGVGVGCGCGYVTRKV